MKFFIVLVCLVVYSKQQGFKDLNPGLLDKIEALTDDCITESKAKEDDVVNMLDNGQISDNPELKCFLKCIHIKLGVLNEAGEIQENGIKSQLPPNFDPVKGLEIVEKCKAVQAEEPCATAFNVAKCIMEGLH